MRRRLPPATAAGLAVGFGAVTAILWELLEYVTFIRHSRELRTAYTDTLGDLSLGLASPALGLVAGRAGLGSVFLVSTLVVLGAAAITVRLPLQRKQVVTLRTIV